MEIANLYDLRESFTRDEILICFSGPFSHSIIEELGNATKRYLEEAQLTRASLMDVFSIFIEQTQNVRNYAEMKAAEGNLALDFNSGIVVIARSGDRYVVSSGNIVERADVRNATEKLDRLGKLDRPGLKAAYKEQLRRDQEPGKGGGLGLIDMSRKATEPLEYSIREIDERYCFFSLKATV
jgi:hypothetical protein